MRIAPILASFRALVAVILLSAGCAGDDRQADAAFHGYMVLGDRASEFGLTPGDTLVEQPPERVPAVLRQEVERLVRRADYRVGCTRYWASGSVTVVLVQRYCYGKSLNDQIIGLFDRPASHSADFLLYRQEGGRFIRHPGEFTAFAAVCPHERDKRGRPSTPCP